MVDLARLQEALRLGGPAILGESTAAFVYRGAAQSVSVIGDMTHWADSIALEKHLDADLFVAEVTLPPDARIEYLVQIDDNEPEPDPANPHKVLNGLGAHSELAMPQYVYPTVFEPVRDGIPGRFDRVSRYTIDGGELDYEKEIHVYLPPGYADGNQTYPVVYILDGSDYIEFAHTPAVLDHLVEAGRIEPVVGVFVSPPNRHLPDPPNRVTEYGLNPRYAQWMADVLTNWVDTRFRTRKGPSSRLVAGDSYAGVGSLYIAFEHPETFGLAYSQSGYLPLNVGQMVRAFAESDRKPLRLYVDVGIFEHKVGLGWLPDDEIDFTSGNRMFEQILRSKNYDHVYAEYPEGHTWGNWRVHMIDALTHFFGQPTPENPR
jgi:enterochelin esterase family protein